MNSIVVTGGAGYVGSVLIRHLLNKGHRVKTIDKLLFGPESLWGLYHHPIFTFIKGDIRDIDLMRYLLKDSDAVFHLAAYVGEHAYKGQEEEAREVNCNASLRLITLAKEIGIQRFIFASTCSNYGNTNPSQFVSEEEKLTPLSPYAEDKTAVEKFLREIHNEPNFHPVICRCATVYGLSPRMRFDLLINELVRDAVMLRKVQIYGPESWRPFIHVDDLAQAFLKILEAPIEKIKEKVFNVGANEENYQKKEIIKIIKKEIKEFEVEYKEGKIDRRNYRVSFDRIKEELHFKPSPKIGKEIARISNAIKQGLFEDPFQKRYTNYL